ncbi:hypothetical protein DFH27DRAFT_7885 [Peziza echinospora]|nr:hypothetical protein DFH27DRAFT_7885 [Peziza echinospora]
MGVLLQLCPERVKVVCLSSFFFLLLFFPISRWGFLSVKKRACSAISSQKPQQSRYARRWVFLCPFPFFFLFLFSFPSGSGVDVYILFLHAYFCIQAGLISLFILFHYFIVHIDGI